jgi:hypothetical protein
MCEKRKSRKVGIVAPLDTSIRLLQVSDVCAVVIGVARTLLDDYRKTFAKIDRHLRVSNGAIPSDSERHAT